MGLIKNFEDYIDIGPYGLHCPECGKRLGMYWTRDEYYCAYSCTFEHCRFSDVKVKSLRRSLKR